MTPQYYLNLHFIAARCAPTEHFLVRGDDTLSTTLCFAATTCCIHYLPTITYDYRRSLHAFA